MNKDVHNEDGYFKRAYHHSKEDPAPEVWSKINAELDKHDTFYYRKKFTTWRLIACLIMLLAGSLAAFYSYLGTHNEVIQVAISKSKVNKPQAADAQTTLADNKNADTYKLPDSSNINSLGNEKALHSSQLHTDKNRSNSYSPQTVKNREHDTPQRDYPPITIQRHNKQQIIQPELTIDSGKLFLQHIQLPSLPAWNKELANQHITDKKSAGSITGSTLAKNSFNDFRKEPITEIVKPNTIDIKDTVNKEQNHALPPTNKTNKNSFTHYWTFTPFISADFTHYKLDNDAIENNNTGEPQDKTDIEERESHKFSYSAGIMAKLQLNRKWGVKTGVIYSNIAIGIQPQTLYASENGSQGTAYKFITSSGYAYVNLNSGIEPSPGDSISSQIAHHRLQYLSIPAMLNYTILNKKHFTLDAATGVSTNILLSTTVKTELDDVISKEPINIHKLEGLRPLYFTYVMDVNLQFYISEHISISIIPSFKYAINPIDKNNIVKTYPYSTGIGAGITCRL